MFFIHPKDMGGVLTEIMETPKQASLIGSERAENGGRFAATASRVTDKPSKSDWEKLAEKEPRQGPVARDGRGHQARTVYGPDDDAGIDSGFPGVAAIHARALRDDVCRPAMDYPSVRRLLDRRRVQRILSPQPRCRAEGALRRLRSRDAPRLRQRQSARRRRRRNGGRCDRQRRGHEIAVRRNPARRDVGQHDHERRGASGHGLLHRGGRGAGGRRTPSSPARSRTTS